MSLIAINNTIRALCAEVDALEGSARDWRTLSEDELFYEAAVCIFGSQMVFETAVAAADRLQENGLLNWKEASALSLGYEERVVKALSKPMIVNIDGKRRFVLSRFRNRFAFMLGATAKKLQQGSSSLLTVLMGAENAKHARRLLVGAVSGLGPKQASLFLRRVGYCSELAILDTHVLEYLRISSAIAPTRSALSRLDCYERIEAEFVRVAREFGHAVGCVDLAMWVTMRVAKRAALL